MPSACTLELKVIPNAPRDEVAGWLGDALKVKIHSPALEGRANEALTEFLAARLGLARRAVTLVRGHRSRHKIVQIAGLTLEDVKRLLGRSPVR
ncbi:MAG: DUF167 domain-containing protein [Acidobacteriia bacterium]|jgi:hypothetical protein|nr:DUF167 domain-containing protein [Terriglobia bacterium]